MYVNKLVAEEIKQDFINPYQRKKSENYSLKYFCWQSLI